MNLIIAIWNFVTNPFIMLMLLIGYVRLGVEAFILHKR